jgi:hypothetical protein
MHVSLFIILNNYGKVFIDSWLQYSLWLEVNLLRCIEALNKIDELNKHIE